MENEWNSVQALTQIETNLAVCVCVCVFWVVFFFALAQVQGLVRGDETFGDAHTHTAPRRTPTGSHACFSAPSPPTFFQAVAKVTAKAEF